MITKLLATAKSRQPRVTPTLGGTPSRSLPFGYPIASKLTWTRCRTSPPSLDPRHARASRAPALWESLPMISRLLGHAEVEKTAYFAHLTRIPSRLPRRASTTESGSIS